MSSEQTKSHKHSEQKLQELYQTRKRANKAPNELKSNIMAVAKRQKASLWRWLNWQSGLAFCCLIVIVGHLSKSPDVLNGPKYSVKHSVNLHNENVYYIDVDYGHQPTDKDQPGLRRLLDAQNRNLSHALALLQQSQQLRGKVRQLDEGLSLEICSLGVIQLSEQIVLQLRQQGLMKQVQLGEDILLLANQQGKIIGIEQTDSGPACDA